MLRGWGVSHPPCPRFPLFVMRADEKGFVVDLDALIEKAQARVREPITETVNIGLGGQGDAEMVPVTVEKLPGHEWVGLRTMHPPRPGARFDAQLGCDIYALTRAYPTRCIKVADQSVTVAQWHAILDTVDAVHIENLTQLVISVNFTPSMTQLDDLGKASRAGSGKKRNSPANSASPQGGSEGGSPRKSPRTRTTKKAE